MQAGWQLCQLSPAAAAAAAAAAAMNQYKPESQTHSQHPAEAELAHFVH